MEILHYSVLVNLKLSFFSTNFHYHHYYLDQGSIGWNEIYEEKHKFGMTLLHYTIHFFNMKWSNFLTSYISPSIKYILNEQIVEVNFQLTDMMSCMHA